MAKLLACELSYPVGREVMGLDAFDHRLDSVYVVVDTIQVVLF